MLANGTCSTLIEPDKRFDYGEDRWFGIGFLDNGIAVVVWTEWQDNIIRIISDLSRVSSDVGAVAFSGSCSRAAPVPTKFQLGANPVDSGPIGPQFATRAIRIAVLIAIMGTYRTLVNTSVTINY